MEWKKTYEMNIMTKTPPQIYFRKNSWPRSIQMFPTQLDMRSTHWDTLNKKKHPKQTPEEKVMRVTTLNEHGAPSGSISAN